MSVASFVHGWMGISCPSDICGACLHLDCGYFKHNWQFRISCSNCSFSPGQYTTSFANSLHLVSPKWPLCIYFNMSPCFLLGMTILVLFNTRPSSMVSSSQKVQNGCISLGTSLILLGHPCCIVYFNITSVSSACVASLICCKLSLLVFNWLIIWYTLNLESLMESCRPPTHDKQSANWFFSPGGYLTVKLYGNVLINILCKCGVAWFKLLDRMVSSSFWSVSSIKWLA